MKKLYVSFVICAAYAAASDASSVRSYLALGDSVPFGLNLNVGNYPHIQKSDLDKYVGFPKIVGPLAGLALTNASCPFETSGSLLAAPGCFVWTVQDQDPLYVTYATGAGGLESQMNFATDFLKSNNVKLITVMIGGNDLANLLYITCGGNPTCALANLGTVLDQFELNLNTIFKDIRNAGYKGAIVGINYYAFNTKDTVTTPAFAALNARIASAAAKFNVNVADAFTAFASISALFGGDACDAGLLIRTANGIVEGKCDNHPSLYGQIVLAGTVLAALPRGFPNN